MNVARRSLFRARSSALRSLSSVTQECIVLNRRFSTDVVAAAATAATAIAATATWQLVRGKPSGPITAPPPLSPITLPGTAKGSEAYFIDTLEGVAEVADRLWDHTNRARDCLYVDLEGIDLCRDGTVSLLVFYSPLLHQVFVVDVFVLEAAAFTTQGLRGLSIQDILESEDCTKAFFDVRNDSDALFHHFGVALRGVEDIQLMENASRPDGQRNYVFGLSRSIKWARILSPDERTEWTESKEAGNMLFNPATGGSFDVFNVRPLSPEIISYCVGDVYYLPRLRKLYWTMMSEEWKEEIRKETLARVVESQQENYSPHSPAKVRSPWEEEWAWLPLEEYKTPVNRRVFRPLLKVRSKDGVIERVVGPVERRVDP
ncbi:hypothetical protein PG994_005508 [Apiospora phragmitis]|uniref:3'-5' exonuclease domain-containing protein n=1 Tax=Apiospora phragmitis TaxID=2905665 RepID=A0ABR1VCH4_9PEZI